MIILRQISLCLAIILLSAPFQGQDCTGINLSSIMIPGQYNVGTITEADGLRDGPDYFEGTLSYPIGAEGPFACIAITTGFFSDEADIADWGPFLASHGFVAFTIGTNSYFDFPTQRAYGLLDALESIRQENVRENSPLFGLIDESKMAVGGWSMGGGGAQYAAVIDPSLKAVLALAPWLNSNSPDDLNHPVPLLILSGENDGTAPVNGHANIHFANTPEATDKLLFEVANAPHGIANEPVNAMGEIGRVAVAWLRTHLLDDPCYCPILLEPTTTASSYLTSFDCSIALVKTLALKTFLQGPYNGIDMNDELRAGNFIPAQEPYTAHGYNVTINPNAVISSNVFAVSGQNAIVDWILVELRDELDPSLVIGSQAALIQKDGDIVGLDGQSELVFTDIEATSVHVALRHRNHLGVRTEIVASGDNITLDFSNPSTPVYGTNAMFQEGGVRMLFAGNANFDQQINTIDKNNFWRLQNASVYDYMNKNADFDLNGVINSVDRNLYWRLNNSVSESLD